MLRSAAAGILLFTVTPLTDRPVSGVGQQPRDRADTSAIPIRVVSVQAVPNTRRITFVLQNTGKKTITAWNVSLAVPSAPDVARGGLGTDAYRSCAGLIPNESCMPPGSTAMATADMPSRAGETTTVVDVEPTVAIFDDKTFVGDAGFAEMVFKRRAVQRDALRAVMSDIQEAITAGATPEALASLLARLGPAGPENTDVVRAIMVRPIVVTAIADLRQGRGSSPTMLTDLLERLRGELAAAIAHSR